MVVYIVHGWTGEYEDSREWIAGVFSSEEAAEKFAELCRADADYMVERVEDEYGILYPRYYNEEYKGHDPAFSTDYPGIYYFISQHILREGA